MKRSRTRSRVRYVKARKLFPNHSELAPWMLPVLVLRSDLWLEHRLIGAPDAAIEALHKSKGDAADFFIRSYFFRGALRSLYSARAVLKALMALDDFKKLLSDAGIEEKFKEANKVINRAAKDFEPLRNQIGGHVEKDAAKARERIDDDEELAVEHDDWQGLTSGLAARAVLASCFGADGTEATAKAMLTRIRDAGEAAFKLLNLITNAYLERALK